MRALRTGTPWLLLVLCAGLLSATQAVAGGGHSTMVTVTAYNSIKGQTQGDPNVTAWGDKLKPGMRAVAVSPDLIRMGLTHGTKVAIAGYKKPFVVLDKTNRRLRRRVDIYMGQNKTKARKFGKQRLRIWWYTSD